jgi:hypothetical protein
MNSATSLIAEEESVSKRGRDPGLQNSAFAMILSGLLSVRVQT